MDWHFTHADDDGESQGRSGSAASKKACLEQIVELLLDTPAQPSAVIEAAAKIAEDNVDYAAKRCNMDPDDVAWRIEARTGNEIAEAIRAMPLPDASIPISFAGTETEAIERVADAVSIDGKGGDLVERIGLAEWGATDAMSAKDHAKHFEQSVEKTAETFDQDRPQRLHGLYIKGTETVICHTGTSPNSEKIARKLEGLWNGSAQSNQVASLAVIKGLVEFSKHKFGCTAIVSTKDLGDRHRDCSCGRDKALATAQAHIDGGM